MQSRLPRCNRCQGFIEHSYEARGIPVYRCTREPWNDIGRYFIATAKGLVEVQPIRDGKVWGYQIIDIERRRLQREARVLDEELEARRKAYIKAAKNLPDIEDAA